MGPDQVVPMGAAMDPEKIAVLCNPFRVDVVGWLSDQGWRGSRRLPWALV